MDGWIGDGGVTVCLGAGWGLGDGPLFNHFPQVSHCRQNYWVYTTNEQESAQISLGRVKPLVIIALVLAALRVESDGAPAEGPLCGFTLPWERAGLGRQWRRDPAGKVEPL